MSRDHDSYRLVSLSPQDNEYSSSSIQNRTRRKPLPTSHESPEQQYSVLYDNNVRSRRLVNLSTIASNQEDSQPLTTASIPPSLGLPWRTGYSQNIPWLGIGSLFLVFCSTTASAIILGTSNGDAVSSWRFSPSVILAILSAVSIACLNFALTSGLNISWWRHMLSGASLADAHRYWNHGNNLGAAITAGRHFNFMSAAKIFVGIAFIEGPLLQKASNISTRQVERPITLQAALALNLPAGYTAEVTGEYRTPTMPSVAFSEVFGSYTNRDPIIAGFDGCPGLCKVTIPGVGFKVSCTPNENTTWSLDEYYEGGGVLQSQFTTNTTWRAESVDGNWDGIFHNGSNEYLTVQAGWSVNQVTPPIFVQRVCSLSLAVVLYPLEIANGTTSLQLLVGTNPKVLADLPIARTPIGYDFTGPTTLGGFELLGNAAGFGQAGPFYANVSMVSNGALALYSLYGINPFAWSHSTNPDWDVMQFEGYTWRDPIDDILVAYHEIMFRLALRAATNATLVAPIELNGINYTSVRNVSAIYTFAESYYVSRYDFLGGAMAVIILAALSLTTIFRGWWVIGRSTTLSPLETAKAFGAPLLDKCNSNDTVEGLVRSVNHTTVKYVAINLARGLGDEYTLQLVEDPEVTTPVPGMMFAR